MSDVCVILVNYKTWKDTVECLESLLRVPSNHQVVVVENGSPDDSYERLLDWAKGEWSWQPEEQNALAHLSSPSLSKPIRFAEADSRQVPNSRIDNAEVVFIKSKENTGFAGGNNIGLRYMMQAGFQYAWLLNNDTVIEPDAIEQLVVYLNSAGRRIGIAGSKLRLYHRPDTLQGLGAVFNVYSGKSHIIGAQQKDLGQFDDKTDGITYTIGAAMFVSRTFLEDVGLMSEDYFLYNEENDWSARAHRKGWGVGVAAKSIVYHKQGASTGNSPKKSKLQIKALTYKYRGKILLYKKYYRGQLLFLYLHLIRRSIRYILKGNFQEAGVIYKTIFRT